MELGDIFDKSIPVEDRIDYLELKVEKEESYKFCFQRGQRLAKQSEHAANSKYGSPYQPSVTDVELWEKYGDIWPDPEMLKVHGDIVQRNWKRLEGHDWVRFYDWLVDWKSKEVDKLKHYLERCRKEQRDQAKEEKSDKRKVDGYETMKKEAQRYLDKHKEEFRKTYKGQRSTIVKNEILPHLKENFPGYDRYPSEPYLRNDVLEWW